MFPLTVDTTVYKCKITEPHKEEAKARYGLQRHIRRRNVDTHVPDYTVSQRDHRRVTYLE
jgi:hypothetical protein